MSSGSAHNRTGHRVALKIIRTYLLCYAKQQKVCLQSRSGLPIYRRVWGGLWDCVGVFPAQRWKVVRL